MRTRDIQAQVRRLGPWYQNIYLGDGISTNPERGDYPESRWRLMEPYVPEDLTGKTVLDLGANAGYFSIRMKQRGASYVLGIDVSPSQNEQAKFVGEVLGAEVDFRLMNAYEYVLTDETKFDFVLFLGVFYHLRYPLLVLDKLAEKTREKLLFQTVIREEQVGEEQDSEEEPLVMADDYPKAEVSIFNHRDYPKMFFIEKRYNSDNSNWWFCNEACAFALLRSAGIQNAIKVGADMFVCDAPGDYTLGRIDKEYPLSRMPRLSDGSQLHPKSIQRRQARWPLGLFRSWGRGP